MKAIRKSDGKVIEVEQATAYDGEIGYWDYENCDFHYPSDLNFNVEEAEQCISVAKLREILITLAEKDTITNTQAIMIINQVKKSI